MRRFFLSEYDKGMAWGGAVAFLATHTTWGGLVVALAIWLTTRVSFATINWLLKK